jgi:hypothetical protein
MTSRIGTRRRSSTRAATAACPAALATNASQALFRAHLDAFDENRALGNAE